MNLLEAKNVKTYYHTREGFVKAVDGVSIEVRQNEILGIAGESGCGKSTLINTLTMNIRPPMRFIDGTIVLDGIEISKMTRNELKKKIWGVVISLVPQSAMNCLMPTMRIIDLIKDIVKYHINVSESEILSMAKRRFEELNLPIEALKMYPHELSGGMRQRAVIATSTILNPKLLIVDEPTSALDVSTQKQVLRTLKNLRETGIVKGMIFVAHDIAVLRQIVDRLAVMYAGKIAEIGNIEDIIFRPRHPYTKLLINAVVSPEPEVKKRGITYIPGEPPNLLNPPSGCRFHPRCPYAREKCKREEPILRELDGRILACHFPLEE